MATSVSSAESVVGQYGISSIRPLGAGRRLRGKFIAVQTSLLEKVKVVDSKLVLPLNSFCMALKRCDIQLLKSPVLGHLRGAPEDWYGSIEEVRQSGEGVNFEPLSERPPDLNYPAINKILDQLVQVTGDLSFGLKKLSPDSPARDFAMHRKNVDLLCADTIFAGVSVSSSDVDLVEPDSSVFLLPTSTKFQKRSIRNSQFLLSRHPLGTTKGKYCYVDSITDLRKLKGSDPKADWCCEVKTGLFDYSKKYVLQGGLCFCHAFADSTKLAGIGVRYGVYPLAHQFYHATQMVAGVGLYLDPDFRKQVMISKGQVPCVAQEVEQRIANNSSEKEGILLSKDDYLTDQAFAYSIHTKTPLEKVAQMLDYSGEEQQGLDACLGKAYGRRFLTIVDGYSVEEAVERVVSSIPVARFQTRRVARILFSRYSGQIRNENGIVKRVGASW